jgi:hypothetical protein
MHAQSLSALTSLSDPPPIRCIQGCRCSMFVFPDMEIIHICRLGISSVRELNFVILGPETVTGTGLGLLSD